MKLTNFVSLTILTARVLGASTRGHVCSTETDVAQAVAGCNVELNQGSRITQAARLELRADPVTTTVTTTPTITSTPQVTTTITSTITITTTVTTATTTTSALPTTTVTSTPTVTTTPTATTTITSIVTTTTTTTVTSTTTVDPYACPADADVPRCTNAAQRSDPQRFVFGTSCQRGCEDDSRFGRGCVGSYVDDQGDCYMFYNCCYGSVNPYAL